MRNGSTRHLLSDGGIVRSLPLEWAMGQPLGATHALGVQLPTMRGRFDMRRAARRRFLAAHEGRVAVVTPRVALGRNIFRGRAGLEAVYRAGREAVDDGLLETLRRWAGPTVARGA